MQVKDQGHVFGQGHVLRQGDSWVLRQGGGVRLTGVTLTASSLTGVWLTGVSLTGRCGALVGAVEVLKLGVQHDEDAALGQLVAGAVALADTGSKLFVRDKDERSAWVMFDLSPELFEAGTVDGELQRARGAKAELDAT